MKTLALLLLLCLHFSVAIADRHPQTVISDKVQPVSEENIFWDPLYFNWCNSIIKGKDGRYHLFYSRWEKAKTFNAWLTHSKVAHAVADHPAGPYHYVGTVLNFDKDIHQPGEKITAHNPKIKYFDGKYYLYFISTRSEAVMTNDELETIARAPKAATWTPLRENQRTFVAISESLDGPWQIAEQPLLEPYGPIETLVVNPAITQGEDGRYYLIVKGDEPGATTFKRNQAVAVSDYPDRDFKIQPKPVIQKWDTEDVSMWYDKKQHRQYAVFHAHTYVGMMTSKDGINWEKADDFKIMKKEIQRTNGNTSIKPNRMERPSIFIEKNHPAVLSMAVLQGRESYIVFVPLKK